MSSPVVSAGSKTVAIGDIVFARAIQFPGVGLLMGIGSIPLPPIDKAEIFRIRKSMQKRFGEFTTELVSAGERELRMLYFALAERVMNPPKPTMCNTDGDPLEFRKIFYRIDSLGDAVEKLSPLAWGWSKEELESKFTRNAEGHLVQAVIPWAKRGNKIHKSWDNTVLGHMLIEEKALSVEVNSVTV